ncbi:MAG: transposase [Rhodanobacteraceae bacterium]|nr:MAG: transposase [Rhodanobacteraceae bacterium]
MKKSKFSGKQIVRIPKEVKASAKVGETCRKHGISESTYYAWKNKYAGMDVSQMRHLKGVEMEPARVKRMYADTKCKDTAAGSCRVPRDAPWRDLGFGVGASEA